MESSIVGEGDELMKELIGRRGWRGRKGSADAVPVWTSV